MGDVVDQLHDKHRFAHTGTTEQTDLTTLAEGLDQVDDLDTGIEDFLGNRQVAEGWCRLVDGSA